MCTRINPILELDKSVIFPCITELNFISARLSYRSIKLRNEIYPCSITPFVTLTYKTFSDENIPSYQGHEPQLSAVPKGEVNRKPHFTMHRNRCLIERHRSPFMTLVMMVHNVHNAECVLIITRHMQTPMGCGNKLLANWGKINLK